MLLGKRTRKVVAATFLTILTTNIFAPGISYALTSGPTQPEATNFEPIDTTDMVNQQTGDFTYNMPLLEVPGPEGGYPLSLAYHAGIMTNQDASWVGLGWTLNPGEINRSVNGYPDDWHDRNTSTRVYWSGGNTTSYSVGISIGIANSPANVNFGLTFANDTYRGFGVGVHEGIGTSLKIGDLGLNLGITAGVSPYGGGYLGANAGLSYGNGLSTSIGVSATTNFESLDAGFSGGIGYSLGQNSSGHSLGGSLLGVSMSTSGGGGVSAGGFSASVHNSNAGKVSTHSTGFSADIPVYYGVNLSLGFSKTRYWTDETQNISTVGSLWASGYASTGQAGPDNVAYDAFSLLEDPSYKNSYLYPDPTIVQGGAYPDFDVYNVNAQGLAGSMRPYLFQGGILNQNILDGGTRKVTYYNPGGTNLHPRYRFVNDFSNSYRQTNLPYSNPAADLMTATPPMDGAPQYGDGSSIPGGGNTYDNMMNNDFTLAGSRYVDPTLRIHPRNALGYNKFDKFVDGMIEGYSITNESGMTYHFGLPAYSFNEESYQEKIHDDGTPVNSFNRDTRTSPYAYTWYLTTITGPDFVDRNGNGIADDGDWGYWVNFEYGKWTGQYNWRNPSEGFQRDEDNQFRNVSMGTKEIYYLNAIRTRTHLALFEKDARYDGKGETADQFLKNTSNGASTDYFYSSGRFDGTSAAALRLSRIYLLNAADEGYVSATTDRYNILTGGLGANVLDAYDVAAVGRANLEAKAIRVVDFNYDYSLCPGTSNSFDPASPTAKLGKLTLNNVISRGKGGVNLLPATQFGYEQASADMKSQTGVSISTTTPTGNAPATSSFTISNASFAVGDLIMTSSGVYCGAITNRLDNGNGTFSYTTANSRFATGTADIHTTKNPPYNKDAYDGWQMYKGDIDLSLESSNENASRMTTPASAPGADAWSLRTITTALGAQVKVSFEPDEIISSVYNASFPYPVTNLTLQAGTMDKVTFKPMTYGYPIQSLIHVLDNGGNILIQTHYNCNNCSGAYMGIKGGGEYSEYYPYKTTYRVDQIDGDGTVHATLNVPIPATLAANDPNGTFVYDKLYTGNISTENAQGIYGGGLRTNKITVSTADGSQTSTSFNYNNPSSGLPSGVTSYLPSISETLDMNAFTSQLDSYLAGVISNQNYKTALNSDLNYLYSIARELPPPQVMYEYVTVTSQTKSPDESVERDLGGSTMYQFEVFRKNMVGRTDITPRTGPIANGSTNENSRNLTLQKFTASLGNLKRTVQYDNNGKPISETINHYLHDNIINEDLVPFMTDYKNLLSQKYNYQGYKEERYFEAKLVQNQPSNRPQDNGALSTLSAREEFPAIQTGQTVINYVNGTQTSTTNLAFDYYSGAITKTLETDAYGNNFVSETVAAYRQYAAMGLKVSAINNKNMLTQTAETRTWVVDATDQHNHLGLVSANVTTWSDLVPSLSTDGSIVTENSSALNSYGYGDAWRPQYTYSWLPSGSTTNGLTAPGSFADFSWTSPASSPAGWVKNSENTLYDVYSKSLEGTDINGNYSATRLNYGEKKVILTGSPANYYEIAYSGAEDAALTQTGSNFVTAADGTASTTAAHTGAQSLQLGTSGKKGFLYSVPVVASGTNGVIAGRSYMASVWVKPASGTTPNVSLHYSVNGTAITAPNTSKTAGAWTLVTMVIPGNTVTSGTFSLWCQNDDASIQAYVDDMRFQPLNASTTAYVYDPFSGELTHILDNSNLYTRFEYDAAGRLVRTYKEKLNTGTFTNEEFKTNQYRYNYSTAGFTNAAINASYAKNNCPFGYTPSSVQASVPAGQYTSYISQQDANNIASGYAQDFANLHGSCSCSPTFTFNSSINSRSYNFNPSGTRINFSFGFIYPATGNFFTLGKITGACVYPTNLRTIPMTVAGNVYNVMVYPDGTVNFTLVSGTAPTGGITLSGVYDQQMDLQYSDGMSANVTKTCPTGYVSTVVPVAISAYAYAAADKGTANTLANNALLAAEAAATPTCIPACTFTWASNITNTYITSVSVSGSTLSFHFQWQSPTTTPWTGGTIGTIGASCAPSGQRSTTIVEGNNSGRTWNLSISNTGAVSLSLVSGNGPTTSTHPVDIIGSVPK